MKSKNKKQPRIIRYPITPPLNYIITAIVILCRYAKRKIWSLPTLDEIVMVEKLIKKKSGEFTKSQLREQLPKLMAIEPYLKIVAYLEYSNKIGIDKAGKIAWIQNNMK